MQERILFSNSGDTFRMILQFFSSFFPKVILSTLQRFSLSMQPSPFTNWENRKPSIVGIGVPSVSIGWKIKHRQNIPLDKDSLSTKSFLLLSIVDTRNSRARYRAEPWSGKTVSIAVESSKTSSANSLSWFSVGASVGGEDGPIEIVGASAMGTTSSLSPAMTIVTTRATMSHDNQKYNGPLFWKSAYHGVSDHNVIRYLHLTCTYQRFWARRRVCWLCRSFLNRFSIAFLPYVRCCEVRDRRRLLVFPPFGIYPQCSRGYTIIIPSVIIVSSSINIYYYRWGILITRFC